MSKKQKTVKKTQDISEELHFAGTFLGIPVNFEIDAEKSLIDWRFEKQGRNLSVEMFTYIDTWDAYKTLFNAFAGRDFVKEDLFSPESNLDALLKTLKQNKLLFDFMIVECTIIFEDENSHSEFVRYSGFAFTVNGRKHLEDESNGVDASAGSETSHKGTA